MKYLVLMTMIVMGLTFSGCADPKPEKNIRKVHNNLNNKTIFIGNESRRTRGVLSIRAIFFDSNGYAYYKKFADSTIYRNYYDYYREKWYLSGVTSSAIKAKDNSNLYNSGMICLLKNHFSPQKRSTNGKIVRICSNINIEDSSNMKFSLINDSIGGKFINTNIWFDVKVYDGDTLGIRQGYRKSTKYAEEQSKAAQRGLKSLQSWVGNAAKDLANNRSSYDSKKSSSSSNKKTQVAKTNNSQNNKHCSYKIDNKRGNSTIIKCSDGHRADIKFKDGKWKRKTGILSGGYDSLEEAANKECGCRD